MVMDSEVKVKSFPDYLTNFQKCICYKSLIYLESFSSNNEFPTSYEQLH